MQLPKSWIMTKQTTEQTKGLWQTGILRLGFLSVIIIKKDNSLNSKEK